VEPRPEVLVRTLLSLRALAHAMRIFSAATAQTLGKYKILFYFLRVEESPDIQQAALAVVHLVATNKVRAF
jgi:hypothetical protein